MTTPAESALAAAAPALAEATVLNLDGAVVRVGTLFQDRTAVLVFLRHFGWMFCAQQAAEFRAHQAEIEAQGARLAFIGSGSPAHARHFRTEILKLPAEVQPGEPAIYSDTRLDAFKAAGLRYGVWRTVGPSAIKHAWAAMKSGFRQKKTMGQPWQQGGVLIVKPGGELKYAYASEEAGDHPPVQDVLGALRR